MSFELAQAVLDEDPVEAAARRARAWRGWVICLVVTNLLVLAVGWTRMLDLRRLQTPEGTAVQWVRASVIGDCDSYLSLSVVAADRPEERSPDRLCQDLRAARKATREQALTVRLRVRALVANRAEVVLSRGGGETVVTVDLVRRDGRWKVLRNAVTCDSVGCA